MKEFDIKKDLGFKQISEATSDDIFIKDEKALKESLFSVSQMNVTNSVKKVEIELLLKTHLESKKDLNKSFYSALSVVVLFVLMSVVMNVGGVFFLAGMVAAISVLVAIIGSFIYLVKSIMGYFSASSMLKKLAGESNNTLFMVGLVVFFVLGAVGYPFLYFGHKKQEELLNDFLIKNGIDPIDEIKKKK